MGEVGVELEVFFE
jgi:hypothetical protein